MVTRADLPHTYKEQRRYERDAAKARDELLMRGATLPPVCGYTYIARKPKDPQAAAKWKASEIVCMRVAGSNTDHHGTGYCDYHMVAAELHLDSYRGEQVSAARRQAYEQARFFGAPMNIDPHTAILQEIGRTAGIIAWLDEQMEIERAEMVKEYGVAKTHEAKRAVITQFNQKTGGKEPSVWMVLYQEERKHLVSTCTAAIKAGIAQRKVEIAEVQGRMIAAMMMAFIHDPLLSLTPDQSMRAPELVRKHLMLMAHERPDAIDPAKVLIEANSRES